MTAVTVASRRRGVAPGAPPVETGLNAVVEVDGAAEVDGAGIVIGRFLVGVGILVWVETAFSRIIFAHKYTFCVPYNIQSQDILQHKSMVIAIFRLCCILNHSAMSNR